MDLGLKGKVALVSAASKGLGYACALELAREGCRVVIAARGHEALEVAREMIVAATGAEVLAVRADVTRSEEITRLVEATHTRFGRVDILVNNAGGPRPGSFDHMTDRDWQEAMTLTLLSVIRLSTAVVPIMRRQRWGRIINITSTSVKQPIEGLILSNTVRPGVIGFAKTLANELAPANILVNNVCPGVMVTDRFRETIRARAAERGEDPEALIEARARLIPVGRLGEPQELAALVAFLASERASYLTGTTIPVDGGLVKGLL